MKNGPVRRQWTRPHLEALTRQATPMTASDAVHKRVRSPGVSKKPSAKAHDGTHQRRRKLERRRRRSRSEEVPLLI
jgi:hypothetical protein